MADLHELSLIELRDLVRRGEASRAEIARAFLDRAAERESLRSYLWLNEDLVSQAEEADRAASDNGALGPLEGLPVAVKDNICTTGAPTTCGSRILEGWIPPYDATAWKRLKQAGALLLGKTNCDEFAMGSSTEHSAYGAAGNPWDPERVPGGSSGGSAAAVSDRTAPASLGSDTGGSVRQPASFCGVVGLKPTYGRVSRFGLVAFASSLDQIGPMSRTAADCALLTDVMGGADEWDSTSTDLDPDAPTLVDEVVREPGTFRFGVPPEATGEGVEDAVRGALEESCAVLEQLGGERVDISLPHTEHAIAVYYVIAPAEASSNLARYDGVRYGFRSPGKDLMDTYLRTRAEGFGPEVKRRIMLGTYALSAGYYDAYYKRASQVRTRIGLDYAAAFEKVDVIVTPTSPTTAFRIGERTDDPLSMYLCDAFTVPANLAGLPGISLPCGLDDHRLPIGLQLVGPSFSEAALLRLTHHFLEARPFRHTAPN